MSLCGVVANALVKSVEAQEALGAALPWPLSKEVRDLTPNSSLMRSVLSAGHSLGFPFLAGSASG